MLMRQTWKSMTEEKKIFPDHPLAADDLGRNIVSIAASRDREAFGRLFDHFGPRIKGFLIRRGTSAELADDLAQEALLTVWRKADYFDPAKASASTWIFTIVRNLRIDRARREKRAALHAAAGPEDVEPPIQPIDALELSQRQILVRDAMKTLPADQLEVVRLSFVEGMPHAEISQTLQIPLGTVKSRMRLAMTKLKGILEGLE